MMIGYHIAQPNDPLQKISLQHLIQLIVHPSGEILSTINMLRSLKITDPNAYKQQKKLLPYFTISLFHPPYRKSENFAASYYCIFDLDHLSSIQKKPDEVKELLSQLEFSLLTFVSPGLDGVKMLIELEKPCKEPAEFKTFYRAFINYLIARFPQLSTVIDRKTNDVTRATFLSYDPQFYYNPSATKVNIPQIISNYSDVLPVYEPDNESFNPASSSAPSATPHRNSDDPDEEILQKIKTILGSKSRPLAPSKNVIPSQQVNQIIPLLKEKLHKENILITHSTPINYGQQITFQFENLVAQLNIFYGKKGFSVVPVPRKNTNTRFALYLRELIAILIDETENQNNPPSPPHP